MTVFLEVIAASRIDELPEPAEEPASPAVMPSPSGVFLIHVAPSPRLDPSKPEDVTIVDDDDDLSTFIID
jgi:hypothetical protein